MPTKRPNLSLVNDTGYRFRERDPELDMICQAIRASGMTIPDIIEAVLDVSNSSVWISYGCIAKWLDGTTRRPQNHTLTWVARALGYHRSWSRGH